MVGTSIFREYHQHTTKVHTPFYYRVYILHIRYLYIREIEYEDRENYSDQMPLKAKMVNFFKKLTVTYCNLTVTTTVTFFRVIKSSRKRQFNCISSTIYKKRAKKTCNLHFFATKSICFLLNSIKTFIHMNE